MLYYYGWQHAPLALSLSLSEKGEFPKFLPSSWRNKKNAEGEGDGGDGKLFPDPVLITASTGEEEERGGLSSTPSPLLLLEPIEAEC